MSATVAGMVAVLDHVDIDHSKVKIMTAELVEETALDFDFKVDLISLTDNFLVLVSGNTIRFYSREDFEKVHEITVESNIIKFEVSGDEQLLVVQTSDGRLQVYSKNGLILTQHQEKVSRS